MSLHNRAIGKSVAGRIPLIVFSLVVGMITPAALHAAEYTHHDLTVTLHPGEHRLAATDTITVPGKRRNATFVLQAGLSPAAMDPKVGIRRSGAPRGPVPLEAYTVTLPPGTKTFTLRYGGIIPLPRSTSGGRRSLDSDQTGGVIAANGVYLDGNTFWYPRFDTGFMTFRLVVKLPAAWDAVSQGYRARHERTNNSTRVRWECPEPQEEIYLVASRFAEYEKDSPDLAAMVFLREPDEAMANRYLEATFRYIALYDKLLGPYPYRKFALVENFRETGLGMPSFTLLGPTVIRLPFIIDTSYPHEILHNWWGNSVYPLYEKGNWSEGLTAYLADHLLQEQQGKGADYRMTTLQKYADYVRTGRDFPLTEFLSRHNPATEAIGYGKSLMFFHMLRLELGDDVFVAGLREFYRNYKFRLATFDDIEKSLEAASGKALQSEFDQWVRRPGAPQIMVSDVKTEQSGTEYVLTFALEQIQTGDAYLLRVPVAVTMEGQERAYQTVVVMSGKKNFLSLVVPFRPLRLDVDPEFDVFRRLDPAETPPAISNALGAKKMVVLLPSTAGNEMLRAYEGFAKMLSGSGPDEVVVRFDRDVKRLPADRSVVVLGWENAFLDRAIPDLRGYNVALTPKGIELTHVEIPRRNHSFVLTVRNEENRDGSLMFIAADRPDPLPGLARKLPHYHKYSYLAFEGDEPRNVAKGRWPVLDSPLTVFLPHADGAAARVERGRLADREALAPPLPGFSK
jgi:aminopeptidase N